MAASTLSLNLVGIKPPVNHRHLQGTLTSKQRCPAPYCHFHPRFCAETKEAGFRKDGGHSDRPCVTKQLIIYQNKNRVLPGETGKEKLLRYYKNICLGFKTPNEVIEGTCIDKKCPFTGKVSIQKSIHPVQSGDQDEDTEGHHHPQGQPDWRHHHRGLVQSKAVRFKVHKVTKVTSTKKQ